MKKGQKEGPNFTKRIMHCRTKDNIEISVIYVCQTSIINDRAYRKHTDPGGPRNVRNVGWRDKLQKQIENAIAYVLKHYRWSAINTDDNHKDHIERQIRNCLHENYQEETVPLFSKGLMIETVEIQIEDREKTRLY